MKNLFLVFFSGVLFFCHANSYSATPQQLIEQAEKYNSKCRGGSGDYQKTEAACNKRDELFSQLNKQGWCYGHEGQYGYEKKWEKCRAPQKAKRDLVRLWGFWGGGQFFTGDTVPEDNVWNVLYLDKPCKLPIVNAHNMRHLYTTNHYVFDEGCWYETLSGDYVLVHSDGRLVPQPNLKTLPRALLNPDGSAEIIEPEYDSKTFLKKILDQDMRDYLEQQSQRRRR